MAEENKEILEEEFLEEAIMLQDEDGNQLPFYHITTLEHEGKDYVYLQQADDETPSIEIFELETVTENDEEYDNLLPIDDALYETLYAKLIELVEANDCDCESEECDCGCDHHHE